MATIELRRMEFFAHHGHLPEERLLGNYFYVDVAADADLSKAIETDCLDDTVNYQQIYEVVKREMEIPSRLLEHVTGRIVKALYAEVPGIKRLSVKVTKQNPPLGGKPESSAVQMIK
ncbi:MAG: dihydroneopterin aldolase [Dysgonamonadaceae bacterium]|jgi:dihydroneopterin aldolase|nr:dihydroneopterin aldolase [Dysgonamonadaceae bacterium]